MKAVDHLVVRPVSGTLTRIIETAVPNIFLQGFWYLICVIDIDDRIVIKGLPVLVSIQD